MNIKDYGFDYKINSNESIGTPARITAVHKGRFAIVSDFGEGYAQLKGKEYYYENEVFPTVGDFVLIDHNRSGDSRIIKTLERRTYFSRRDPDKGRGEQAVAANFDYVFIMQSLNHDFNPKRLERYLTAARQSKAEPVSALYSRNELCSGECPNLHRQRQNRLRNGGAFALFAKGKNACVFGIFGRWQIEPCQCSCR